MMYNNARATEGQAVLPPPEAGQGTTDIHYESIGKRELAAGDALSLDVASGEAAMERVVEWTVSDQRDPWGRMQQSGLEGLELAAVAPSAFGIEEQIVLLQDFGDVGLERDQVRGILGVAADRQRAGDVLVDQPERPAEQVDAGGDDRRPDARIVEDQRLDEIVDVAAMVRRVHDTALLDGVDGELLMLADAFDLSQDRIERILERAVQLVALRRLQFFEIAEHPAAGGVARQPVAALDEPGHVFAGENRFRNRVWPHC